MLSPEHERYRPVHQIILSQAVAGEAIAIRHLARMICLSKDLDERLELVQDAGRERAHLLSLRSVAADIGAPLVAAPDPYWDEVGRAFDSFADAGDLDGCYIVQDVVLECYAITLYRALETCTEPFLAELVRRIADEEERHMAHGIERVRRDLERDPSKVHARIEEANESVARVLAGWVREEDCEPICGVCGSVGGTCAKDDLRLLGMDLPSLQPAFAQLYGDSLRAAGLGAADVARWLARLIE